MGQTADHSLLSLLPQPCCIGSSVTGGVHSAAGGGEAQSRRSEERHGPRAAGRRQVIPRVEGEGEDQTARVGLGSGPLPVTESERNKTAWPGGSRSR